MTTDQATKALESLTQESMERYTEYFKTITPTTPEDVFRRALFAFASVHTTWKYNVRLYTLLEDLEWLGSRRWLHSLIEESQAGLTNNRTKYIWQFAEAYWDDPESYLKTEGEWWPEYRDRLQGKTLGLGHAKSSFMIELLYPTEALIVCGDTHQLQLYGLQGNTSPGTKTYNHIERHWVYECTRLGLPPVAARWALWDRKQGREGDSRYWSYILEDGPRAPIARQLKLFNIL